MVSATGNEDCRLKTQPRAGAECKEHLQNQTPGLPRKN